MEPFQHLPRRSSARRKGREEHTGHRRESPGWWASEFLDRFITRHHWDVRRFNALRLNECLRDRKGGVLSLDDTTMYEYLLKSKEVLTQTAAPCPKCGTKIKYENYPGNRVTMVCPTCGSTESVSLEKPSKQPRTRLFFSSPKEKQ